MRLDQALVARGLCDSRTEAQELIKLGFVFVNTIVCNKQTSRVSDGDDIVVTKKRQYVSRGGEKLRGVLEDVFGSEQAARDFCSAKIALDIGSSTGGFTDYVLQAGVAHVDCVDVGTEQLHPRLRNDARVSLFERTDIREFKAKHVYDIIVADLSFIALRDVFDSIISCGVQGRTYYILLIKPQFEVGKGNTKKGIVKDELQVSRILDEYRTLAMTHGLFDARIFPCHIQGGDGNQEYFLVAKK